MIFISSLSASRQSQSQYGKVKYEIEQFALQHNIDVIRPGLIYSHDAKGLMGAMQGIVKKLPIVPLIGNGNQPFHVCQIDCLMQLIQKILKHPQPICYPIAAGHPTPKTFKEILKSLAQANHKSPLFIPIPWTMIYCGLKIAELLHIPVGFRSDSLLSLKTIYDDNRFELPPELQIEWQQIESF